MKKFIILFIAFLGLAVTSFAQERTVLLNKGYEFDLSQTKWYAYNGNTADYLLPTTRDTIDYVLQVKNQGSGPLHFYALITLDTVAGVDTVAITVQQKKFAREDYSDLFASALYKIRADTNVVKTSLGVTSPYTMTVAAATDYFNDEVTTNTDTVLVSQRTITQVANTLLYPRYLKFRLILSGNDAIATGIRVKRIELQFYN